MFLFAKRWDIKQTFVNIGKELKPFLSSSDVTSFVEEYITKENKIWTLLKEHKISFLIVEDEWQKQLDDCAGCYWRRTVQGILNEINKAE